MRPSEELDALLTGAIRWQQCSASVRSWAQFKVYKHANHVAKRPTQDARRAALANVPESIREQVEQEARRLFDKRKTTR